MIITINDDFDLKKIAESGQCFRWTKIDKNYYQIIHLNHLLKIKKLNGLDYELSCSAKEFDEIWRNYFDLDEIYSEIRLNISRNDKFLIDASKAEKGIRILRQDPWEMLFSFIISQNNNVPAIIKSIDKLCNSFGTLHKTEDGEEYFSVPSPEKLVDIKPYELKKCGVGYRDKYLLNAAKAVVAGKLDLEKVKDLSDADLLKELKKISGVGDKVANCVLLFGFHRLNAFPIDVWVKRIVENEYNNNYPMEQYAPYNGVYQQYMFAYYRHRATLDPEFKESNKATEK